MLTKGAIGNLINRYKAVLAKCNLINTFGSLAVASMLVLGGAGVAGAIEISDNTILSGEAYNATQVTEDSIFVINSGATLTINDGVTITGEDKIAVKVTQENSYDANKTAYLIINGGTITSDDWFAISGNGRRHSTAIKINGGEIKGTHGIYHPQLGSLVINDGYIEGENTGVEVRGGNADITGGTFVSHFTPTAGESNASGSTIKGAAFAVSQHTSNYDGGAGDEPHTVDVTISGGTFTGDHAFYEGYFNGTDDTDPAGTEASKKKLSISITGGTFNGKIFSANKTNFIHGGQFNDLSALNYIGDPVEGSNGALVKLDKDFTTPTLANTDAAFKQTTPNYAMSSGKATLDLAGYNISINDAKRAIEVGDAELTIINSGSTENTISSATYADNQYTVYTKYTDGTNKAKLNIGEGVRIEDKYGSAVGHFNGTLTIDGATLIGQAAGINGNGTRLGTTTIINSGTIKGGSTGIYHPQQGTLTINGGTIEGGETGIEMRSGSLTVTGGTISGNGNPYGSSSNPSGGTTIGAALAISQHSTNNNIDVVIKGGEFNGVYALSEVDVEDDQSDNIKISVEGGTFNGMIYSENVKDFISGGTFSDDSALQYLASKATITVTDEEISSYVNESGDEHSITFGAKNGSTVETVMLADNSTTTFDGKAAITTLSAGENTTLNINSSDISAQTSTLGNTAVNATGDVNDAVGGAEGLAKQLGTSVDNIGALNMEEGLIAGAVINGVQKVNTVLKDTLEQATAAPLAVNRILMNDVRKRMGDLRDTNEDSGVWMRWDGGKLKGDEGLTNNFNTIQIGGDMLTGIKNVRAGVAASFTHGDIDHSNGSGEMEAYTFAAYGTWMADNGMFADVIGRVGFTNSEIHAKGGKADLDNEALSLSAEYGWRFDVCKQFYVEPQAELTYTHMTGADFSIKTAQYDVDSVDSLIGRAGLAAGWKLPNHRGNIYARASVVHEFLGDSKISATNNGGYAAFELDGDDTWLEYGIGANVKLTDKTYIWADVERTEGADIDEEWRGTVGIRYSF